MNEASGQWDDLLTRILSGTALAAVGLLSVWAGGYVFHVFVTLICALMVWELARMLGAGAAAVWLGALAGVSFLAAVELPGGFALPLIFLPALVGLGRIDRMRLSYALFSIGVLLAGYGLVILRDDFGFFWMLWLALVVISTDLGGYFAGRMIGGPKIWPKISPKKTWSGTVAGWVVAALVSIPVVLTQDVGWELLGIAVALSMASQLGDVSESAIKRRVDVKDSSNILPGHGGLLDRFDSMLGASLLLLLVEQIVDFPPPPVF